MKKKIIFLFLTVSLSINAISKVGNSFTTEEGIDFVKRFYVEYLEISKRETCETLRNNMLSKEYRPKLDIKELDAGYDFMIRAQDANVESAETVTVIPIDNRWYMASYLDIYSNKRIRIPVHLTTINGEPRIDNIITEGDTIPQTTPVGANTAGNTDKDITILKTFYKKYLKQVPNDDLSKCRLKYMTADYFSFVQKSSISDNTKNVFVCGVVQASKLASSTVKVSYLKDWNYLVAFVSNGKKYQKKVHLTTSKGKLAVDRISAIK